MEVAEIIINHVSMPLYSINTLIIGSGAASLNTAVNLIKNGQTNICIATDNWGGGTSNNSGSDKQTYYKLSLSGNEPDSARDMAKDLFNGGCMHGDIALCETKNSVRAFFHLVELGVPFPHDRFGGYVGYKTDNDSRQRATSAGPLTSHLMFEALAREVKKKGIEIFDQHEVIALLTAQKDGEKSVVGAIAIDNKKVEKDNFGFVVFNAMNVVFGTGGPAGMYKSSVYPESQLGATGMALKIGAVGNNLTESQFGLASIKFRWNVSGSYQQVIPRYVSTDQDGKNGREFLNEYFPNLKVLANAIFLKGYQWPFDPRKVLKFGSSLIDILVYRETVIKNRRVFLDYSKNPSTDNGVENFSLEFLDREAHQYLERSNALQATPIARLRKINQPAIDLYKQNGIDLTQDFLEIAVCAQHNNGGLKSNIWWESNIKHLFPVGEVNGTHGVYRPGGSALNSGQVGSMRAALFIAKRYNQSPMRGDSFVNFTKHQIEEKFQQAAGMIERGKFGTLDIENEWQKIKERMTTVAAHIRGSGQINNATVAAWEQFRQLIKKISVTLNSQLSVAFRCLDMCLTQVIYLEAILEYLEKGGKSRGSYLVLDVKGEKPCGQLENNWRFSLTKADDFVNKKILEISLDTKFNVLKNWVDIRPIPDENGWFENVWQDYLNDEIIQ